MKDRILKLWKHHWPGGLSCSFSKR